MYYYFAQFMPDNDQKDVYNVAFPDLPGCFTFGEGLVNAMQAAMDALTGYLEVEMDAGKALPPPSDYAESKAKAEAHIKELGIEITPGTLYQLVPADPRMEPFVRLNISMQPRLLAQLDRKAKKEGMTRSGLLAVAAREYMDRTREDAG